MKKILHLLKDNKAFNALLNKQNIVVNSSNSEALLIASAFLTLKKDMLIVNINGPINAGKSTICRLLAKDLPDCLFIEADDLLSDEEQEIADTLMNLENYPYPWSEIKE